MRACTTASGGVMFIPDTVTRKKRKTSYQELVNEEADVQPVSEKSPVKKPRRPLFGKRKATEDVNTKAA